MSKRARRIAAALRAAPTRPPTRQLAPLPTLPEPPYEPPAGSCTISLGPDNSILLAIPPHLGTHGYTLRINTTNAEIAMSALLAILSDRASNLHATIGQRGAPLQELVDAYTKALTRGFPISGLTLRIEDMTEQDWEDFAKQDRLDDRI